MVLASASVALTLAVTPIDPQALGRYLDRVVPARLEETGVPGVVISVVQGERVLLARGFGRADLERGIPMDGEHTVVRVASISKTFTATAVAQLEAQGRVDLDTAVREYLPGAGLPAPFGGPITLRHLLSHSAGIINNNVGRVSREPPSEALGDFIARTMPPQVRPAGVAVVYSNHGNALAGLVVERVSGQRYPDYVAEHIVRPLRMASSSFERPPHIEAQLATGYVFSEGQPVPYEYLHFKTMPASTLHTTAADMAHFMVMHLQEGRFEGQPVLPPAAAQRMRRPVPAIHPALPSYHYAFAHAHTAGHPTRSHGGSVPGFLSRMVLFDEHEVGVFVAQNSLGDSLPVELVESIARRFLPAPGVPTVVPQGDGRPRDPARLVGHYRRLGKGDTPAFTRALTLLAAAPLRVGTDDEGFLTVDGARFIRTDHGVFHRQRPGRWPEPLVFVDDAEGQVRWVHRGLSSAERPPWHASRAVQLPLLSLIVLVLLAAALRRRSLPALAARLSLLGLGGAHLAVAWIDAGQVSYLRPMRFGVPVGVCVLLWLVPLAAGLAWLAVIRGLRSGSTRRRRPGSRRGDLIVAVATTLVPLLAWYWSTPAPGFSP